MGVSLRASARVGVPLRVCACLCLRLHAWVWLCVRVHAWVRPCTRVPAYVRVPACARRAWAPFLQEPPGQEAEPGDGARVCGAPSVRVQAGERAAGRGPEAD